MPTRRVLLRLAGGAAVAGFSGLCAPAAPWGAARGTKQALPSRGPAPEITITAPNPADARYPIPIGIHVGPLKRNQRIESIEINLGAGHFPGVAQFTPPPGAVAIACQIRLEQSETLLVTIRLGNGTSWLANHRVSVSALAPPISNDGSSS